jgi:amino-acid N-acetyltransferase
MQINQPKMKGIAVVRKAVAVKSPKESMTSGQIGIMQNQIMISPVNLTYRDSIISLLQSEKLPVEDLPPSLPHFFMATDKEKVVGAVGLEIYEHYGLLRSLVVQKEYRGKRIADALVRKLENLGRNLGLSSIYLLTETAQDYFSNKGYETIQRNDAPASLQQSSEFSHMCPVSAILMQKKIQ